METEFRFLDQLERDLRDAAARDRALDPAPRSGRSVATERSAPRRRHPSWVAVAASLAFLLCVAGAIGALSQLGHSDEASSAGSAAFDEAPAAQATTAPDLRQVHGNTDTQSFGADYSMNDRGEATGGAGGAGTATPAQDLSKIVRDGSITVVVPADGFGDAFDQASTIAESAGGFVLSSSISQEDQGTLTLRVPAKKLDGAVVKLRGLGRLAELSLSGRDVTADYIDLKARLQVLQTQRDLIVKLLNASTSVGGQLSLSNRFADVQTQIERIQGSLNVLNDKVDLATLKVTLREEGVAPTSDANDDVQHPSLGSAWDRAVQGFFGVIAAVVVGLGYLVPLLVLAGAALLIRRAVIRRRAAN